MKPYLGAPVLVLVEPSTNGGSDTAPAVITRIWSDTCVNVRCCPDVGHTYVLTSQVLHESREAAEQAHDAAWAHVAEAQRPTRPVGTYWPPAAEHHHGKHEDADRHAEGGGF